MGADADKRHSLTVPFVWQDPRHESVERWCKDHRHRDHRVPWLERRPLLGFRGSPTGGYYGEDSWEAVPRARLVLFSRDHPDLADARFTGSSVHVTKSGWRAMQARLGVNHTEASFVDMHEESSFRYLASVDGNGWAARLPFLLCSGSLVIKQESELEEFWYSLLKPYEHYLPVARDLRDLEEKVLWARAHDAKAKRMADAAGELIRTVLTEEFFDVFAAEVVRVYATEVWTDETKKRGRARRV